MKSLLWRLPKLVHHLIWKVSGWCLEQTLDGGELLDLRWSSEY